MPNCSHRDEWYDPEYCDAVKRELAWQPFPWSERKKRAAELAALVTCEESPAGSRTMEIIDGVIADLELSLARLELDELARELRDSK